LKAKVKLLTLKERLLAGNLWYADFVNFKVCGFISSTKEEIPFQCQALCVGGISTPKAMWRWGTQKMLARRRSA